MLVGFAERRGAARLLSSAKAFGDELLSFRGRARAHGIGMRCRLFMDRQAGEGEFSDFSEFAGWVKKGSISAYEADGFALGHANFVRVDGEGASRRGLRDGLNI